MSETRSAENLNHARIQTDDGDRPLLDFATESREARVACHFRDIRGALLRYIARYDHMVGCVAWLTDPVILQALAARRGVAIIVQKEDFLRPDTVDREGLRRLYAAVPDTLLRVHFRGLLGDLSVGADPSLGAIRCVGNHNADKRAASPRAHHKFLVFGHLDRRAEEEATGDVATFEPAAVWTGSFNFTVNGGRSLENAVFIEDRAIAQAYLDEFSQVAALSEPLDWETAWCEPQWRVGT